MIRGGAHVIRRAVRSADEHAETIVAAARAEAADLRARIRDDVEAEAAAAARADLAAAMIAVEVAREEAVAVVHDAVAELAIAVARKLVADDLAAHPERVRAHIEACAQRVARGKRTVVRVNPVDVPHLAALPVEVKTDPTLAPGDCVVESDLGEVDGRMETKLARTLEALRGNAG